MQKDVSKKYKILLLCILILGFTLRIVGINWGLPYLYNTDEYKLINFSLKMGATKTLNPKFFIYPTFYLYFMLGVYFIVFLVGKIAGIYETPIDFGIHFVKDPTLVYVVTRFFSAFFGTLTIFLTYKLGKKIYNEKIGLIAAFMLAVLRSFVEYSHYAKIEMFSTFLVVLFALCLYHYYTYGEIKYFYISCILLGLAVSSRYLPIVCISMVIFVGVIKKLKFKKLILGILLVGCFFVIGSPYVVLDYKTFLRDTFSGHIVGYGMERSLFKGLYQTIKNYLFLGTKTSFIGILGILGITNALFINSFKEKFLLIGILGYFLLNIIHYHTEWHYIAGSFPFLLILAAKFVDRVIQKYKPTVGIFLVLLLLSLVESIILDISFILKDTRTEAKEWIEKNIPSGSKILIDMYAYSPQLKMTKKQIEKLYNKAVELKHYKKEYLYYQLLAHPGDDYGYEIYQVWRPFYEITTIKHEVEEAQKVQQLIDVNKGIEYVKKFGIQYVIINSINYYGYPLSFYRDIETNCQLLKEFAPKTIFHPGPVIRIYKLG